MAILPRKNGLGFTKSHLRTLVLLAFKILLLLLKISWKRMAFHGL
ncbi:hypothetical protein PoMZ_09190 [Pyricularia oryzae]|uniref:Uncharacterized protein n=1 Tax=Pyricularia oryzae TaxID=318829 RepID=A0A4P7MZ26_PYROR|nr:hypothetical protein PoMZ_09190 [Pyricularia oryzae]